MGEPFKTEEQVIAEAQENFGELEEGIANPGLLLAALETFYMNGTPDEQGGDVESPTGHYYLVDRWIVITDSQGFKSVETYATIKEATDALDKEYSEWMEGE
jgi:hypothetical protein